MKQLITPPGMSDPRGQTVGGTAAEGSQLKLNPRDLEDVTCEKCGGYTFQNVVLMKRISPLQSPNGREAFVPAEVFACAACGHVNDRFIKGMAGWFKGAPAPEASSGPLPTAPAASQIPTAPVATGDGIITSDLQTVAVEGTDGDASEEK